MLPSCQQLNHKHITYNDTFNHILNFTIMIHSSNVCFVDDLRSTNVNSTYMMSKYFQFYETVHNLFLFVLTIVIGRRITLWHTGIEESRISCI